MAALTVIAAGLKVRMKVHGISVCSRVLSVFREKKQKKHKAMLKMSLMSGCIRRVK